MGTVEVDAALRLILGLDDRRLSLLCLPEHRAAARIGGPADLGHAEPQGSPFDQTEARLGFKSGNAAA